MLEFRPTALGVGRGNLDESRIASPDETSFGTIEGATRWCVG